MRRFFSDKKNIVMVSLIGAAVLSLLISSFVSVLTPVSCILAGVACLDVAYVLFLRYAKIRKSRVDEFMQEESSLKRKTTRFIQSEGKMNNVLLIVLFAVMGVILLYYALRLFVS